MQNAKLLLACFTVHPICLVGVA